MDFDPMVFLRCHSEKIDMKTDTHTQVWYADFMPDPKNPALASNIVVTAGGRAINFINVDEQKVWKKYYCSDDSAGENFFCSTWINVPYNDFDTALFLVAGSTKGKLHFLQPDQSIAAGELLMVDSKKKKRQKTGIAVNTLCVHKDKDNNQETLLCGLDNGVIYGLDVKCVKETEFFEDSVQKTTRKETVFKSHAEKLGSFSVPGQLFQMVYCPTTQFVLMACDSGLWGVHMPSCDRFDNNNQKIFKFQRPQEFKKGETELSDSVQIVGDGLISVKYALHACIYIFDLKNCTLSDTDTTGKQKESTMEFVPQYVLDWSNTDNYFLNVGLSRAANLLACGDDQGTIWVYDIESVKSGGKSGKTVLLPVTAKIPWPDKVHDKYAAKKQKLDLNRHEIVINKVAIHSSGRIIVAVTNNNTVCLWKRVDDLPD